MLVLTRMVGERLVIGTEIVVQVAGVDGLEVQLGIEAPRSIPVLREEVAIRLEHECALSADAPR